ncbi:hypothetical protein BDP27DRAFT_1421630 [Rhodocollybia butyracea]|uniref:Uncharacterized protein n=1 Tax=Rhodocollybia butyracea TaxID=206335 RepID=A0A9P5PRQ3_9AGAR|nr:hypothetical protein BDP27DRAFT_1421630 [Rhodocollybia butyracea]
MPTHSPASIRFPSESESARRRFHHARRVPNDKASNRHMACVSEDNHKITFCSSVSDSYTTVTFVPPKRKPRHSDAPNLLFPSSTRLARLAEKEENMAAADVEVKAKLSFKKLLKQKLRQLLPSDTSKGISSASPALISPSTTTSDSASVSPTIAPSRKGTSLFHFGRTRHASDASRAATIGMTSTNKSNLTLNLARPENTSVRRPRNKAVRRSRSFNDIARASIGTRNALDSATRDLADLVLKMERVRESFASSTHPDASESEVRECTIEALDHAFQELANNLRRRSDGSGVDHSSTEREWSSDDEETLCRASDTGDRDLDNLLDEATEEAIEYMTLMNQGGWHMKDQRLVYDAPSTGRWI